MLPTAERQHPEVGERILLDNSIWQRLHQPAVRAATDRLLAARPPWVVLTCAPVVAEVGLSARSGADHDAVRRYLSEFPECEVHPTAALVLDIQNDLFNRGYFRAVGVTDTLIAAYAIVNEAVVVHYDQDFELVARVRDDFRHQWIADRGSLDA